MPSVIIRDLPVGLHRRLKENALRHHRSMNHEILAILEKEIGAGMRSSLPQPIRPLKPLDPNEIVLGIRRDRDSRA